MADEASITPTTVRPTVGRIVYHRVAGDPGVRPAVVLAVTDRGPGTHPRVAIQVFDGHFHNAVLKDVPLFDPGHEPPDRVWAEWMPYQIEAARRYAGEPNPARAGGDR